jgi:predicted nucleotidyltransferase
MVEEKVITIIKQYLTSLCSLGIHANRAVLFGSFALGGNNEYSDIDIIVIAPEFDGTRDFSLVKSLWGATVCDYRIEPIACGEKEWKTDRKRPILEIARREGVIITV